MKKLLLSLAMFGFGLPLFAAWDMSGYADMSQDYVTRDNCKVDSQYVIGSTYAESSFTISAENTTAGDYVMDFMAGAKDVDATFKVTVTSADYTWESDYTVTQNGKGWDPNETKYLQLKGLPAGDFTIKLTVLSTSNKYAGNYGKFEIKACSPLATSSKIIDLSNAQTAGVLTLKSGCKIKDNNTDIENTGSSTAFEMMLSATDEVKYTIAYKYGAKNCAAKLGWSLVNQNGETKFTGEDIIVDTGSWTVSVDYKHEFGELPAGIYFFKAAVTKVTKGDKYAGNYGDFTWTQTAFTRYGVTAPCNEGTTVEVTSTIGSIAQEGDTYNCREGSKVTVAYTADTDYYFEEGVKTTFDIDYLTEDVTITAPIATRKFTKQVNVDDVETVSKLNWLCPSALMIGGTVGAKGNLTIENGTVTAKRFNLGDKTTGPNTLTIKTGGKLIMTGDPTSGNTSTNYLGYATSENTVTLDGGYLETKAVITFGRNGYTGSYMTLKNGATLKAGSLYCNRDDRSSLSLDATSTIVTKALESNMAKIISVPEGKALVASAPDAEGYITYTVGEPSENPEWTDPNGVTITVPTSWLTANGYEATTALTTTFKSSRFNLAEAYALGFTSATADEDAVFEIVSIDLSTDPATIVTKPAKANAAFKGIETQGATMLGDWHEATKGDTFYRAVLNLTPAN